MASSEKWAVLIGIDFYINRSQRLKGCVNDIEDMHLYLEKNYSSVNISKFIAADTNDSTQKTPSGPATSWPTYENIMSQLKHITNSAPPGAFVYIHYSGHGASKPTTASEYRENYGSDTALVLFDNDKGEHYLRGIELASLFDDMVIKQIRLTVVLDCCRSGGVSRDNESTYGLIRGVPWDDVKASAFPIDEPGSPPPSEPSATVSRDAFTNQHWLLRPRGYTLMAACGPDEIARECRGTDGREHGAFSYFLLQALVLASEKGYKFTYGSIYRQLCAKFHVPWPRQHPILFGNGDAVFMDTESKRQGPTSTCNIIKISEDGHLGLNGGHAHGVCLGDEYTVYPFEPLNPEALGEPRTEARVKIKAVNALQSEVEQMQSSPDGRDIKAGWYATLLTPFRPRVQVGLFPKADKSWKDTINKSPWLREVDRDEALLALPYFQICITEENGYTLHDGHCDRIPNLPVVSAASADSMPQIVIILEHLAKFANIEGLESQSSHSLLESDFSIEMKANDPSKQLSGNRLQVEHNGKLSVIFRNHTNKTLNLTVFDMGPLRQVSKLYPSMDRGDWKAVPPKQIKDDIDFPGQISFTVKMKVPNSLNVQGQSQVEDVLKFFVTTRPTSFAALELPELSKELLEQRRSSNHALFTFLQSLSACYQRDAVLRNETSNAGEKWACRNFTICTTAHSGASP
jgi:Caspase domain